MRKILLKGMVGLTTVTTLAAGPAAFAGTRDANPVRDRTGETHRIEKRSADVKVDATKDQNVKDSKVMAATAVSTDPSSHDGTTKDVTKDASPHDGTTKDGSSGSGDTIRK